MMPPPLNFHQIIEKFFKPLNKKYRFWTVSASVIIGIAFYVGVDIVFAELVRQNSYPIHMLAAELLNEHGPEFVRDSNEHAETIKQYTQHLEQRGFSAILRILYPEHSPKKALASALSDLQKVKGATEDKKKEDAKKAIWQAGLVINQLYMLSERFPRSPFEWFKSEDLPVWLSTGLEKELDTFHEQVDKFEDAKTKEAAIAVCRDTCRTSRKIMLLLSLAVRLGYDIEKNEEKIELFLSDLKQSRKLTLDFAEKYKSEQNIFEDRFRSKDYRFKILKSLLGNKMDRVHEVLSEWIEFAITWREVNKALEKEKGNVTE